MESTKMVFTDNRPTIEYIGYYNMLDKIVEQIDKDPKNATCYIQSYEKILELIARIKEAENVKNN